MDDKVLVAIIAVGVTLFIAIMTATWKFSAGFARVETLLAIFAPVPERTTRLEGRADHVENILNQAFEVVPVSRSDAN